MDHGHDAVVGLVSTLRQRVIANVARGLVVGSFLLLARIIRAWPFDIVAFASMAGLGILLARRYRYARIAVTVAIIAGAAFAVFIRGNGAATRNLAIGLGVLTLASALVHLIADPSGTARNAGESRLSTVPIDLGIVGTAVVGALTVAGRIVPGRLGSIPTLPLLVGLTGLTLSSGLASGLLYAYRNKATFTVGRFGVWKQFAGLSLRSKTLIQGGPAWVRSTTRMGNALVKIAQRFANFLVGALNGGIRAQVRVANAVRRALKITAVRISMAVNRMVVLLRWRIGESGRAVLRSARIIALGITAATCSAALVLVGGDAALRYVVHGKIGTGLLPATASLIGALLLTILVVWAYTATPLSELLGHVEGFFELGAGGALATFVISAWVIGLTHRGRPLHVGVLTLLSTPIMIGMLVWTMTSNDRGGKSTQST